MGGKILQNKNIFVLTIVLAGLLVLSAVSANENIDDQIGISDVNQTISQSMDSDGNAYQKEYGGKINFVEDVDLNTSCLQSSADEDDNILTGNTFDFNVANPTFKFISIESDSNGYSYNFNTSVKDSGKYNVKYVLTMVDGNKVVLNNLTGDVVSYTLAKPLKNLDATVEGYKIKFEYPLKALKLMVDYASSGDYITLSHDYSWVDGIDICSAGGYFFSFENKIIDGNGYTINGLSETTFKRKFEPVPAVNPHDWNLFGLEDNAILKNINLINFTYDRYGRVNGGVVCVSGINAALINVNITNAVNTAYSYETERGYGGAVIWDGDNGLIDKCNIVNCHGGQYGTVTVLSDNVIMNNSVIDNASVSNWIDGSIGATAIRWDGNNGTLINTIVKNSRRTDVLPNNQYQGTVTFTKKPNLLENIIITNSSTGLDLMVLGMPVEDYMGSNVQFESDFIKLTPETITLDNKIFTVRSVRSGTVTYTIDDKFTKTVSVDKNGQFTLDYNFKPSQNYLIKVTYNENRYYNSYTKYFGYNIGDSVSFASFTDLNDLILSSSSSIINLEKNYVFDANRDSDLTDGIIISKDITINGNNHYIDADYNPVRIFTTNANVVLNNLTFKNSRLDSPGNAILANKPISINYCTFDNNWASAQIGGAVNLNGGNSYVRYCTFTNNKAKTGAAVVINSNNNHILYSLFKDNDKDYGQNSDYGSDIALAEGKTSYVNNNALLDYRPLSRISGSYCSNNWYGSNALPDSSAGGAPDIPNYLKANLEYTITNNVLKAKVVFTESDTGKTVDADFQRPVYYMINSNMNVSDTSYSIICPVNNNVFINALIDNQRLTVNQGNSWYVNGSVSSSGSGIESSPYKTLKEAINNANDGDTIYVAPGIYTGRGSNVGLTISKSLAIERWGNAGEVIFDGQQNNYGIFTLNSNTVLSSLTFINSTKRYGGALTITKDSVIIDSIFMDNNVSYDGGAIYISSGGANILNSKFINNHASYDGGAIACEDVKINVYNSIFENNVADKGGAINGEGGESSIDVVGSTFHNNIAKSYGGALAFNGTGNVDYSSFVNNMAVLGGGAAYIWGNNLLITNSEFINNSAAYGGAIIDLYADLVLDNSHFNNNKAFSFGGVVFKSYGDLLIFKSDFSNNYAYYDGGAVYVHKDNTSVFESLFKGNMANYGGGAIHSLSSNLSYSGLCMLNNISSSSNGYVSTEYLNSFIDYGNYTMIVADTSNYNGTLPSRFSLPENGWDTSVKNQGSLGICWDYSVIATVESAIKKATGIEVDLSENNVKNLISKYSIYGTGREPNEGGHNWEALSYLANSLGPIFEETDSVSSFGFSPLLKNVFHIANIGLAKRSRSNPLDNDEVKEAVIKYGAVRASISMDDSYKGNHNYYHKRNVGTNHAVAIVGWDDDYSVSNFPDDCPGNGAWIVKNSWGPDWCNDGYFYVSYYDQSFAWDGLYYIIFNDTIRYDRVYQYDFSNDYHFISYAGLYYKNVYNSVKNEALSGFSTYFDDALDWEVFVYVGDELKHTQNGSSISSGYFTFNFDKKIPVSKGEQFAIAIKVNGGGIPYVHKSDLNSNPGGAGISYYSSNGKTWTDFDKSDLIACLKVFTQNMHGSLIKINPISNETYNNPVIVGFDIENRTNVSYIVKNSEGKVIINKTNLGGKNQVILSNLAAGDYIITIFNEASEMFTGDSKSVGFTINRAMNNIEVIVSNKILPGDVIVRVNADVDGIYNVRIGGKSVDVNVRSGHGENAISLPANLNYITNTSCDTQNYTVNIRESEFNVTKSINNIKINVENTTYPNSVTVKLTADIKGKYIVDINGTECELTVNNNGDTVSKSVLLAPNIYFANITKYSSDSYDAKITTSSFKVEPGTNIVEVSVDDIEYGENAVVYVTASVAGKYTVNINGTDVIVEVASNGGTGFKNTKKFTKTGKYYANVTSKLQYYTETITNDTFRVLFNSDLTLNIVDNYVFGNNIPLTYSTAPNCAGIISIYVDDVFKANISVGDVYELENPDAGKYNVTFKYHGSEDFTADSDFAMFTVSKADTSINLDSSNMPGTVTLDVILNEKATGSVTLTFNNNPYSGSLVNGKTSISIPNVNPGNYTVKITYDGDKNFNAKTYDAKLTINKLSTTVTGTVNDITYSQDAIVNVKGSADGIAIIKIDETYIKNINIIANVVVPVTFENVPAGKHNVTITLKPSDINYDESTYNTQFTVSKKGTAVQLYVEDSVYGEDVVVNVSASNNGKVIITVGNITKEKDVSANNLYEINFGVLAVDSYDADVTFDAGNNYMVSNDNDKIVVSPAVAKITEIQSDNNVYGEKTIIKVKTNVAGTLNVKVSSTEKSFNVNANELTSLDLGILDAGVQNIEISLNAGNNYISAYNSTKLTIYPKMVSLKLDINNSTYGSNVIANIAVNESGNVIVKVGSIVKSINVAANKIDSLDFGVLNVGVYDVEASMDLGDNYVVEKCVSSLTVSPKVVKLNLGVVNSVYGDRVVVNVSASEYGDVIVKIGDVVKSIWVAANKLASLDFGVLDAGVYSVEASMDLNDNNYDVEKCVSSLTVSPKVVALNLGVVDSVYGDRVVVNVSASERGKVTVKVGDIIKYVDVYANRIYSINFGNLNAGKYEVSANFDAGSNYVGSSDSAIIKVVSKLDENDIDISVPEIKANQENNIVIKLPNDATGTVSLIIGDNSYTFDVVNGVANISVPKLNEGNYEYVIKYSGDNKYASFENTDHIDVAKPTPEIVVPPLDESSADGSVAVTLPSDATGTVTLVINGNDYSFPVVDGVANVELPDLTDGTYEYALIYSGDGKYNSFNSSGSFKVNNTTVNPIDNTTNSNNTNASEGNASETKIAPEIVVPPLDESSADGSVAISLPSDATGTVTLVINGNDYSFPVVDGVANVKLPELDSGNYVYAITYSGDGKYSSFSTNGSVKVNNTVSVDIKPTPEIVVPPLDESSADGSVAISLPSDATGTVTLVINGNDYSFPVVDGVANVKLPELDSGNYVYAITYSGDGKYSSFSTNGSVKVNNAKPAPEIVVPPLDDPSADGSVTIKLPSDATGKVTLTINGKVYSYPVKNGMANVIIPDLGEGNYSYTITYSGDSKYSSFTTNGSLNKTSPKIAAKNKAVLYLAKGKYSVTVYGTDGKVASGVQVIFKISGKQVGKAKTNTNGVASYVVTKNPGKYKVQATALGKSVTKTLTVKHIVTLKTVALKKSAKKLTLQATLAKVNGKYLKKKTITFKINGKKVASAKTNSKGVAKITIKNPNVVKKLKVGKKVTYQATYLKDTVKKTAKIKK